MRGGGGRVGRVPIPRIWCADVRLPTSSPRPAGQEGARPRGGPERSTPSRRAAPQQHAPHRRQADDPSGSAPPPRPTTRWCAFRCPIPSSPPAPPRSIASRPSFLEPRSSSSSATTTRAPSSSTAGGPRSSPSPPVRSSVGRRLTKIGGGRIGRRGRDASNSGFVAHVRCPFVINLDRALAQNRTPVRSRTRDEERTSVRRRRARAMSELQARATTMLA